MQALKELERKYGYLIFWCRFANYGFCLYIASVTCHVCPFAYVQLKEKRKEEQINDRR